MEATIATTDEPQNEGHCIEKLSLQFIQQKSLVNSCIQPHAEIIWKTFQEVAEQNTKATIQNSENILGSQRIFQR